MRNYCICAVSILSENKNRAKMGFYSFFFFVIGNLVSSRKDFFYFFVVSGM